ncbi:hypothetical protein HS960_23430 [Sphingobacterium paramultivorum]|uniref:DUF4252 domain-containing protein n=1 Tax=Sphingobacterium paramultivorum TaxID=2886510 RepID=A0A7G5E8U8_9SPHI|nr:MULTISPECIES: hypothetical protein [Sphingobacterium]MCS4168276.1 hypothetical protein [Sphingobacterium sp. BIGb0116]QMV70423.1 hypothetical protein HS960_23430 [Sphingobacterium paramultivorum]WSO14280.1 hypothetical protein VUL84_23440 [Sphingobacterium paramultivorum]
MKRIIFLLFIILINSVAVQAQQKTRAFQFKKPVKVVEHAKYSKINLYDAREIKDNLGVIQVGMMNANRLLVAEPSLEKQLQSQLEQITGRKGNGELLMRLEKFCIAELTGAFSEKGFLDFRAILFSKEANGEYLQLARVDTAIVVKGMDVTKATLARASEVVNNLIFDALTKNGDTTKSYSLSEIEHYDDIQKKQLALYNTSTYKDGLYRSYEEFALQTPSGGQAQLREGDLNLGFFKENEKGKLKKVNPKDYYAVVHAGNPFISSQDQFYALIKEDDDFIFVGPVMETASATNVVVASVLLGAIGGALVAGPETNYYTQKLDYANGSFIRMLNKQ